MLNSQTKDSGIEQAALHTCATLLTSNTARALPDEQAKALVILAFTYGAAWALDRPDMIGLGDAQLEALRSAQQ